MPKIVAKKPWTPPEPSTPIGDLAPGNSESSKLEEKFRAALITAGISLHEERLGIQCGYDKARTRYPVLTPDFVVTDARVCIEVDPERTHEGREDQDRTRNALLADAGWKVVRARLGGLEAIGEWDVVSESGSYTVAAGTALADAVRDAVAGRPGKVRTITRKPQAPRKKSRLGAIREDEYQYRVHRTKWTLEDGEVADLAIVDGRYLARSMKWEFPRFIRHLDLQGAPKEDWRTILEPLLETMQPSEFVPFSTFPWGDSLFIGPQAGKIRFREKFGPYEPGWSGTTNLEGAAEYDEAIIQDESGAVLAELHAEAIALGWEISSIIPRTGRHGDYQEMELVRKDFKG
ncbi:hypothetical protein Achl_4049 (plasmid) [Pseudarthrobacter chlorophenolicus A6]|uniref:DUF559 domain-containing protein n=1 Tax=Pseudarthrobacter chlorophenolicus (strain ATCC 700700 / DSM 12829 / CIP 107037 / JCM 12360 / KCTC 9906 / NCIMB 13794 / A6) TaxID=452863 RepID=B8HHV3_PSECP|nr:DUF559 domain-containing protein [Pseudarthrobacter chlorophenolicus]ACL42000.1 hypothetical protein Achl_4049 [Pseudarthrobacter chlorophenolicus A6]SDQ20121.1 Protein of unknown function [Pseudarthrobacter chlorophenolicus]